jgi:prepilin-type N-terminal cleavage/methylation domain-containing protein
VRKAFTLIELLVAMAVALGLVVVGSAFLSYVGKRDSAYQAATTLQSWCVAAQARAKADNAPTGVQFSPGPTQFVQEPGPLAGGQYFLPNDPRSTPPPDAIPCSWNGMYLRGPAMLYYGVASSAQSVTLDKVVLWNFDASQVAPGDYLVPRGSRPCYVFGVQAGYDTAPYAELRVVNFPPGSEVGSATTEFRLSRAPRRLLGEDDLNLPVGWSLDAPGVASIAWNPDGSLWGSNDPTRSYLLRLLGPDGAYCRLALRIRGNGFIGLEDYP